MLPLAFFIGKVYNIMAQFCVEIPDDKLNEVLTAMGAQYRYHRSTIAIGNTTRINKFIIQL